MSMKSTLMALCFVVGVSFFAAPNALAEDTTQKPSADKPAAKIVTVQPGDTLSSIADANGTDYVRLFNANDSIANPDIIDVDQQVRVPTADEQLPDRFGEFAAAQPVVAPVQVVSTTTASTSSYAANPAPAPAAAPARSAYASGNVGNRYVWGTCTWYVYERKPNIGSFWGNGGYGWVGSASAAGFGSGSTPVAGAIAVQSGHVAYVESVSGNNVTISEMNYAGGVGVVHYRTVPASTFTYIYA